MDLIDEKSSFRLQFYDVKKSEPSNNDHQSNPYRMFLKHLVKLSDFR